MMKFIKSFYVILSLAKLIKNKKSCPENGQLFDL